jgi:hypothetical protein
MLMTYLKKLAIVSCCLSMTLAGAETVLVDSCRDAKLWKFVWGREFPGAKGGLDPSEKGKLRVRYDFSKGGKYVAIHTKQSIPGKPKTIIVKAMAAQDSRLNYRIIDTTGRVFQGRWTALKKDETRDLNFSASGPWSGSWGGEKSSQPRPPFKSFWLLIGKSVPLQGELLVEGLSAEMETVPKAKFIGQDVSLTSAGWKIEGEWLKQLGSNTLKLTADPQGATDAELSITLPRLGRDQVQRYRLDAARGKTDILYSPELPDDGNERNIYTFTVKVQGVSGEQAAAPVVLTGAKSAGLNLGAPLSSLDIVSSRFGTCTHLSSGTNGAFKGWRPYRQLIDSISDCGFKWIRDGCKVEKDAPGNYRVRPYDLEWMKYAASKKVSTILLVHMVSNQTIEEYKRVVAAIVRDTSPYVNVYELGNEPNNFYWRKTLGGSWNGYEKDGSISGWVKTHLKYTNALADHIKQIRPEATVIGIGASSPTNFHYLNLGVTESLDGVVDHPYTYSMPPEKAPFGHRLTKRDGIRIGDNDHTFAGLIHSYMDHFRKTGKMRSLWVTEFGFTSFWFDGSSETGLFAGFSEEAQAVYLVRRFIESLALPIEVSCQYDFLDDYQSDPLASEANFGIVRGDYSRKPAYFAIQRMNALVNGYDYDSGTSVTVEKAPLHRSCKRSELVRDWDGANIEAANGVKAFALANPGLPNERMLAVWSVLPYSREFNNRVCTLRAKGMADYAAKPIAIDPIIGTRCDVPVKVVGDDLVFENLPLKGHPLLIKLFKN